MTLAVETTGAGPDCVLVHGWGLHRGVWESTAAWLADRFRVHAVDLPGHGESAPGTPGLDAWVARLGSVVRAPAVWIGWSLGGLVSLRLAGWRPDRVKALVLVDSTPRFARAQDWPWGTPEALLDVFATRLETDFSGLLREFAALQVQGAEHGARDLLRRLRALLERAPPSAQGLRQGLDILRRTDLRAELGTVAMPALVVNGTRDRLTHPKAAEWTAAALPDAELFPVSGAAHAPFLSHETLFRERLLAFLADRGCLPAALSGQSHG